MVQNHIHTLINKYLKTFTIHKKGLVTKVSSKSENSLIMVLIDFKYKLAIAAPSCQ